MIYTVLRCFTNCAEICHCIVVAMLYFTIVCIPWTCWDKHGMISFLAVNLLLFEGMDDLVLWAIFATFCCNMPTILYIKYVHFNMTHLRRNQKGSWVFWKSCLILPSPYQSNDMQKKKIMDKWIGENSGVQIWDKFQSILETSVSKKPLKLL